MKKFYLPFLFLISSVSVFAQQKIADAGLVRLIKQQDSLQQRLPVEKLYLQTDKAVYDVGDTIWFKGYLFNANYLRYSSRSGLMYVELANDSNETIFRRMVPVDYGVTYGQIAIDGKDILEGSYTLRAYTNWQRNFGEDYVFTKTLYITGTNNQPWLVKVNARSAHENDKENVYASLTFSEADKKALILRDMQLKVKDGNKTLFKGQAQTDVAGTMDINFNLPPKAANNLNLQAEDLQKGSDRKQNIPLVLNRPENTDLQFMPESGNLVAGIPTKVGFKAIGEDGKGTNISGKIYTSKQEEVAAFSSMHKGMGNFTLNPKTGETYIAKVILSNGQVKTYPLPQVKTSGTVLNIESLGRTALSTTAAAQRAAKVSPTGGDLEGAHVGDSLMVSISTTPDQQPNTYYLTAQSRGIICYAQVIHFDKSASQNLTIPTNLFPTGITRFSILSQQGQPLNERIVYIDHNDNLKISIKPNKQTYTARDSVALNIKVTDKDGKPIQGSFSIAVTDHEQVMTDSTASNLTSNLLLTSDLKGTIEEPQYYLQNKQALDNLLLTQGWTGYSWAEVTAPKQKTQFEAEPEFQIKGKVVNLLGKKVANARVILMAKSSIPQVTQADKDGRFIFTQIPVADSANFFLKATNKNGNDLGMGINIDEITLPEFNKTKGRYLPWYIDTSLQKSISKGINSRLEEENLTGDHMLKQVEIKEKKIIPGSHNLNGPGEADQTLNEKDIEKVGAANLEELLELKVKRLRFDGITAYKIDKSVVSFVMDGVLMTDRPIVLKGVFDSYPAKDITGIEVMTSSILIDEYLWKNLTANDLKKFFASSMKKQLSIPYAFIEITTRNGVGKFRQVSPGTYSFKPIPFVVAKEFYKPRYVDKAPNALKDLRSTIHWEPLVITDKDGKATVSFYASDKPNNYMVVMEGSDMKGNIGSIEQKITPAKISP